MITMKHDDNNQQKGCMISYMSLAQFIFRKI